MSSSEHPKGRKPRATLPGTKSARDAAIHLICAAYERGDLLYVHETDDGEILKGLDPDLDIETRRRYARSRDMIVILLTLTPEQRAAMLSAVTDRWEAEYRPATGTDLTPAVEKLDEAERAWQDGVPGGFYVHMLAALRLGVDLCQSAGPVLHADEDPGGETSSLTEASQSLSKAQDARRSR